MEILVPLVKPAVFVFCMCFIVHVLESLLNWVKEYSAAAMVLSGLVIIASFILVGCSVWFIFALFRVAFRLLGF